MKILHIINNLDNGGAEQLLVNFLPLLKKEAKDVSVLQLSDKNSNAANVAALEEAGIPVLALSKNTSLRNPVFIYKIRKFLKTNRYNVVHVHLFPSMYWVAIASYFIRPSERPVLIFTEHSSRNKRLNKRLFKPVEQFIYRGYDRIVAVSVQVSEQLVRWAGDSRKKVVVIRNGIDISRIERVAPYSSTALQTECAILPDAFTILMTARFSYPKNHQLLIRAMKLLPDHFQLLFAGNGETMDQVKALAKNIGVYGRVHFLGFRTDVVQLMKTVNLNVLATAYEGMSTVALEAMAGGKPFLGANVPGINDAVPDQRFLFGVNDVSQLANRIIQIATNKKLQESMQLDGKAFSQAFDLKIMLQHHLKLYEDAVAQL